MGTKNLPILAQLCLTVAMFCLVTLTSSFPQHRQKRSLLQMCSLFHRHGGEACLRYNGYGCYCGYGNAGEDKEPADDIDRCCQKHDKCYGELKCGSFQFAQVISYTVNCSGPARWKYQCKCKDKRADNPCARSICDCDLQMARCLKRTTFKPEFENYDRAQCKPIVHHRKSLRELRHFRHRNRRGRRKGGRRRKHKHGRRKDKKDKKDKKEKKGKKERKQKTDRKPRKNQKKTSIENVTAVEKFTEKSTKSSYWNRLFGWMG